MVKKLHRNSEASLSAGLAPEFRRTRGDKVIDYGSFDLVSRKSGILVFDARRLLAEHLQRIQPQRLTNHGTTFPVRAGLLNVAVKDLRGSPDAIPIVHILKAAISKVFRLTRHLSRYLSLLRF